MTSITWAGPRCVQGLAAILGPQNRTQGRCDIYLITGIAEIFSGFYMVQSFLNCYMLSRNKRLMCKLSINLKYLCIIYI